MDTGDIMSLKVHYSSRHFPAHLKRVMRTLAVSGGTPRSLWRIHNRALRLGLKQLWAEAGLGPWPVPVKGVPKGEDEVPKEENERPKKKSKAGE